MDEDRKKRLIELGPDILADALLNLAARVDAADELVERLIATPQENIRRYKAKLAGLKRRRRFISWSESASYANELEMLLGDLKAGVEDPRTGTELVAMFYQTDQVVLEQCDDSSGIVGNVFRFEANQLFVSYASKCQDKKWLSKLIFELTNEDEYGVRDILVESASEYLPEQAIRELIERFQETAAREGTGYKKRHCLRQIESLARQLKDAPLFERTRLDSCGKLNAIACMDIARVYLESGDVKTALSWMQRMPTEETAFRQYEYDKLLMEIYTEIGDTPKMAEVAWRIFKQYRSADNLAKLLLVIGQDQRDTVIETEVKNILGNKSLSLTDTIFLIQMGHLDLAETYLLDRADKLEGDFYGELLPLAEVMETDGRVLCATIIYRELLDSILRRAQSRAYAHGVRYLNKLDQLARSVSDWLNFQNHNAYKDDLRQRHGRKRSFWAQYDIL